MIGDSDCVLDIIPQRLRHFWETFAYICLDLSTARILLLVGGTVYKEYAQCIKKQQRLHKTMYFQIRNDLKGTY
jgi:hypothetical protein